MKQGKRLTPGIRLLIFSGSGIYTDLPTGEDLPVSTAQSHPFRSAIERVGLLLSENGYVPDHVLDIFLDLTPRLNLLAIVIERCESPALPRETPTFLRRS